VSATAIAPIPHVSDLALGDVDRDGDLDLVLARLGRQSRLLLSAVRQLDAPWLARPGRAFVLDVHAHDASGDHASLVFLGLRELLPPVPVPPFGQLRVDPAAWFATLPVAFAGGGPGRTTFMLPPERALAGLRFVGQAVVWPSTNLGLARLTNASPEQVAPR
jgi:hypothetical protein